MERGFVWFGVIVLLIGFVVAQDNSSSDVAVLKDGSFYTSNFYIALGIGAFFLVILGVFIWLWLRGSRNKFD